MGNMKRLALLASAAFLWTAVQDDAAAQNAGPSVRNPYAGAQSGLTLRGDTGYAAATSIRVPTAGTLAPQWMDSSSITDPKAGSVTPDGFAKYSSLTSAISAEPTKMGPSGPLAYTLPPPPAPVPTLFNTHGSPFREYQAPTNAFSTPYSVYTLPSLRPAPGGYGSAQIPSTVQPALEAAAEIASGEYLARYDTGNSRRGTNR
jgi:hypothetical protein